jgi:hypothetical protein
MTRAATLKQIPQVPLSDSPALNDFLGAVKQCLEVYQGNIGDGSDVIPRKELPDFENQNADWESTYGGNEVYNKPVLGTAASRDAEDIMTDGAKLPDGHAIKTYGDENWGTGELDNFRIGDETIEGSLWNIIGLDNDNEKNLTIYDLVNKMPWISAYRHGGVFLYYDGNRRFETTIDGITITGDLNVTGGWSIDDFLIGTYTIEANPWNAIKVNGERNFVIWNDQEDETYLSCYRNAGVFLYYNGVRILETATEGIKLSNSDQSIVATIGPQTIEAATWQGFNIAGAANFCVYDADNSNSMIGAYRGEGIFLYYNGTKKFETSNTGIAVVGSIVVSGNVDGKDISSFGTAVSRNAEDSMTDGANLPDGAAVKAYGDANWGVGAALQNVVEDTTPELGGNLYTNAFEIVFNNAKFLLFKDVGGSNRYGIGLTAGDDWQIARDADTVSIGYNCTGSANPVMIRVNSTNDKNIQAGAADSGGSGYRMLRIAN